MQQHGHLEQLHGPELREPHEILDIDHVGLGVLADRTQRIVPVRKRAQRTAHEAVEAVKLEAVLAQNAILVGEQRLVPVNRQQVRLGVHHAGRAHDARAVAVNFVFRALRVRLDKIHPLRKLRNIVEPLGIHFDDADDLGNLGKLRKLFPQRMIGFVQRGRHARVRDVKLPPLPVEDRIRQETAACAAFAIQARAGLRIGLESDDGGALIPEQRAVDFVMAGDRPRADVEDSDRRHRDLDELKETEHAASDPDLVWLASYPRSGNTLLRTILWHCFGLKSGSVYPHDLGGRTALERYVGHIERSPDGQIRFPPGAPHLVKTHEPPRDRGRAIYVVRDARAASVSLWRFYGKALPLEAVIEGRHRFGTWSAHLRAWQPWQRPGTLLLRYEELAGDLAPLLPKLSAFLGRPPITERIPPRATVAGVDGRWVRPPSDWRREMPPALLERCTEINRELLIRMGYLPADT